MKCFGTDAINSAFNQTPSTAPSKSIFATFACLNQKAVSFSHCAHTSDESWYIYHPLQFCSNTDYELAGLILQDGVLRVIGP